MARIRQPARLILLQSYIRYPRLQPIPHAKVDDIFREVLLAADHNAYHIGEMLTLRQIMEISPAEKW